MLRRTRRLLFASLIASAACAAHAAELGDPRVSSHIGQQLVADIELTLLEDPNTPVQVRLASPEVYSEAGIAVPPVLSSLNLSVMRRDGRQFLHATTLRPVEADHLHLYLELVDHGQRVVRLATLWLTPDPDPAPAPAVAPAPAPVPVPAPAVARAPARVEAEPAAPALAWARRPAPQHLQPVRKPAPAAAPLPVPLKHPAPLPLPVHAAARPAACVPQSGEAQACIALGVKNAELRARIGRLEQRVKGLQASLGAEPGKAPAHTTPKADAKATQAAQAHKPDAPGPLAQPAKPPARPSGPLPISAIKPLVPHKAATAPADQGLPWAMIGGALALLAALGGAAALLRARAGRARKVSMPDEPGMLPRLRERFFVRNGGKGVADPVDDPVAEPTLE